MSRALKKGRRKSAKVTNVTEPRAEEKQTKEERARRRLEATDRTCDGCGTRIGRWTDKCHYDPTFDRVYCSTGGCAAKFSRAPFCVGCGEKVSPFESKGVTVIPRAGANDVYCARCSEPVDGGLNNAAQEEEEKRPKKGLSFPSRVVDPQEEPSLTDRERRLIGEGPYVVVERRTGWFQVVRPLPDGSRFVRTATNDRAFAFNKCAKFNGDG